MLTVKDKDAILRLRDEGHSYQTIHNRLGFAISTIRYICQQFKQKNGVSEKPGLYVSIYPLDMIDGKITRLFFDDAIWVRQEER